MKYKEIDFNLLVNAVTKKSKYILIIAIFFSLLGSLIGYIYITVDTNDFKAKADVLNKISKQNIVKNDKYYLLYEKYLKNEFNNLLLYANTIKYLKDERLDKIIKRLIHINNEEFKELNNHIAIKNYHRGGGRADEMIVDIEIKLNSIIDEFNILVKEIAIKNTLIIKAGVGISYKYKRRHNFDVLITHTYVKPNAKDDFLAIVTFLTLVGIVLGYLTALCKVAKNEE